MPLDPDLTPYAASTSGSVGSVVASRNQYGPYFRPRTTPTDPQTTLQLLARAAMAALVPIWQTTLTDAQRLAWNDYAARTVTRNRLGRVVHWSGFVAFLRGNLLRHRLGLTLALNAPTRAGRRFLVITRITINTVFNAVVVEFPLPNPWFRLNGASLVVYTSSPQSAGTNFFKGPYRIDAIVHGSQTSPPLSPHNGGPYWAAPVPAGGRVYARVSLTWPDGRFSGPNFLECRIV